MKIWSEDSDQYKKILNDKEQYNLKSIERQERLSQKEVEIASIFVCMDDGETIEDGCRIMKERSYDIPVWGIDADSPLLRECEIKSYPRVLILDKERRVIFNGSLGFAKRKLNILL